MSDRERWVLYPLLFFSLVLGLRASYLDPWSFRCREIECQNLKVSSINGMPYMNPVVFAPALEQAVRQAVEMGKQQGNLPVGTTAADASTQAAPIPAAPTQATPLPAGPALSPSGAETPAVSPEIASPEAGSERVEPTPADGGQAQPPQQGQPQP
jgi:hypothetical protein